MNEQEKIWFQAGVKAENERILMMLNELVDRLDKMRPESYKSAADLADFRIRILRNVIKKIQGAEPTEKIEEMTK